MAQDSTQESTSGAARFRGKIAFITGAGDRGIGGAIAERLGAEGATIFAASLHEPQRLPKRLARQGTEFHWIHCDVTQEAEVRKAVHELEQQAGQLDVVVNNAGVEIARPFEEMGESELEGLLQINLLGAARVTRLSLPLLRRQGGVIVNVSSALAMGGCDGFAGYSASKAGLMGLTQSLAVELAPDNIRVVGVAPALVFTPMIRKHLGHLTDEVRQQIENSHPLGVGSPHDVSATVAFLASEEARWITGTTVPLGWISTYRLPVEHWISP